MDRSTTTSEKYPIKKLLAQHLGLSEEDIHDDDSLREDLHMSSAELTDFLELLTASGIAVDSLNFVDIETVDELIESIQGEEI